MIGILLAFTGPDAAGGAEQHRHDAELGEILTLAGTWAWRQRSILTAPSPARSISAE
ncbi:hypothetical protein M8494_15715 [Serratia ureilytica]